jgi:hypothetical protein
MGKVDKASLKGRTTFTDTQGEIWRVKGSLEGRAVTVVSKNRARSVEVINKLDWGEGYGLSTGGKDGCKGLRPTIAKRGIPGRGIDVIDPDTGKSYKAFQERGRWAPFQTGRSYVVVIEADDGKFTKGLALLKEINIREKVARKKGARGSGLKREVFGKVVWHYTRKEVENIAPNILNIYEKERGVVPDNGIFSSSQSVEIPLSAFSDESLQGRNCYGHFAPPVPRKRREDAPAKIRPIVAGLNPLPLGEGAIDLASLHPMSPKDLAAAKLAAKQEVVVPQAEEKEEME